MNADLCPRPDAAMIHAYRARVRLWLLRLLAAFLELFEDERNIPRPLRRRARAMLAVADRRVRLALAGLTVLQAPAFVARRRAGIPPARGRARRMRGSGLRRFTRSALRFQRHRGLKARLRALIAAMDAPENSIARLARRLRRGLRLWRIAPNFAVQPAPRIPRRATPIEGSDTS